jgi:hypothetical protein
MKIKVWLAVLWLVLPVLAQESVRELARETKKVQQEIAREKELHAKETARHKDFIKSSNSKLNTISQQTASVKSQTDSCAKSWLVCRGHKKNYGVLLTGLESVKILFSDELASKIDSIVPVLELDHPYKREESAEQLRSIAAQLRRRVISPEEGFGRVWDVLLERIRLGYTSETYSGYLDVSGSGQGIPGKYLRYGAIWSVFVSQDGEDVYFLNATQNQYQWVSAGKDLALRQKLKEALKVAEGKSAPQLVPVPFYSSALKETQP